MATKTLCPTCQRWVFGEDSSPPEFCPVCSSPTVGLTLTSLKLQPARR
jgi:hypothetical protein